MCAIVCAIVRIARPPGDLLGRQARASDVRRWPEQGLQIRVAACGWRGSLFATSGNVRPRQAGQPACVCRPSFQAQVWSARDRKTIRKTFRTVTEALAWRQEAKVALHTGHLRAPSTTTLAEGAEEWLERAEAGVTRTRSGDPYKPAAIRAYRHALDCRILPGF